MRSGSRILGALLACAVSVGCGRVRQAHPAAPNAPVVAVRCGLASPAPGGYHRFATAEVPEGNHIGVRVSYRNDKGQMLYFTSGVAGDFAEGGRSAGMVPLAAGIAQLFDTGEGNWVLVWQSKPPCTIRTVEGEGFRRGEFVDAIRHSRLG